MNDIQALRRLIRMLKKNDFQVTSLWDGEVESYPTSEKDVLEVIFNLDECWMNVRKSGYNRHTIYLIPNNGEPCDMFTDWSFSVGDSDGFNSLMDKFLDSIDD